jgi:hypothetical protein
MVEPTLGGIAPRLVGSPNDSFHGRCQKFVLVSFTLLIFSS